MASLSLSFYGKPDTAPLYPWYSAQMCHSPWGHAERVGSMYNGPKERHLGKNNEKNGLWMLRGHGWNDDWCCLREGVKQILEEGRNSGEIKNGAKRKAGSSWSHLSVWNKDWCSCLRWARFEMFHRIQPASKDRLEQFLSKKAPYAFLQSKKTTTSGIRLD